MIAHTPQYKTIIQTPVKTVRAKFFVHNNTDNSNTPVFEGDENSITLSALGGFIGSGAKKITAKIVNNQVSHLNELLKIDLQAKTDGNWETITLGYFTVYTAEYNVESNTTTLELYDPMYMMSVTPYSLDSDIFPTTISGLAAAIAGASGLDLDPDFDDLPNASAAVSSDLWATINNTTFRDVVNEIAQATGTTAIASNDTLTFRQFSLASESISEPNIIKAKIGQKWGNVNSISLSRMPQNDNILVRNSVNADTNGIYELVIINNQIMDNDRETFIQPLATEFGVDDSNLLTPYLNYYTAEIPTEGHGWYEIGDVVNVNLDGIDYPILITEIALTIDGGFREIIKSVIPTDPSVNGMTSGGILKTLWNTEIKVDKQENDITLIVSNQQIYQDYVNTNFTQIYQDLETITLSVQDGGGVNQIKNSVGYSLDDDGDLNFWAVS